MEKLQCSLSSCYRSVAIFSLINLKVTEGIFTSEYTTESQYINLYLCSVIVIPLAFNGNNIKYVLPPPVRINDGTAARIHR
jgi:hypothetical protein